MSDKIKKQLKEDNTSKKFIIHPNEFRYLNSLENIKNSVTYYHHQLQTEYIKMISLRLGYQPEDNLEFQIDLKDDKRELTIKTVEPPEEDKALTKTE